jgi:hypothetical protein
MDEVIAIRPDSLDLPDEIGGDVVTSRNIID